MIDKRYYDALVEKKNNAVLNHIRFQRYIELFKKADNIDDELRAVLWAIHDMDDEEKARELIEKTIKLVDVTIEGASHGQSRRADG